MADLSLIEGAAILLAGMGIGRSWPARRKPPKPVQPVCGCEHHHSYHDPKTGACHGQVYIGHWNFASHHKPCTCRRYTGPEPLPEYYAPEIGG